MSPTSKLTKSLHEIENGSELSNKTNQKDWNEALNLSFCTKLFKPDSNYFTRLGKVWEKEAELEENISLIIPEAQRTKHPIIIDYTEKISANC